MPGPGVGNAESPIGWLSGDQQATDEICGNNVHAYLDHSDTYNNNNGQFPATNCNGFPVNLTQFTLSADFTQGPLSGFNPDVAVQNLFYLNNVIHDTLYRHGFTESAGNFQEDNFGSGGGGDSVNAEAQDGMGADINHIDNANFATPTDGNNPRMQMYLWNGKGDHIVETAGATYLAMGAEFGPALDSTGITRDVVAAGDGCAAIGVADSGTIALIERGEC